MATITISCGGTPPTLTSIQTRVFNVSCSIAGCHQTASAATAGHLDLSAGSSYGDLVNVPALDAGAMMDGLLRVKPGDPANSLLFIKIAGHTPVAYGTPMPQTGPALSADVVETIREWIADGAKND